ncbi:MAG: DUF4105 domain-containing protein [Gammaproteobacteria bacterium]|jgi:hypothetical protein|nr:DUF4105 domain-containing protein [Gammaproteobacteria bacterium]
MNNHVPRTSTRNNWACSSGLLLLLIVVATLQQATAQSAPSLLQNQPQRNADKVQIALVTFGPGEELWSLFGHNAIRVQTAATLTEPATDLLYNFGYFDLDEAGFYWRYARGIMRYFAVPEDTSAAFDYYRRIGRSIREQKLNLAATAARQLARDLQRLTEPDARVYDYDYFYYNCSTRVRDLLDQALGQQLQQATKPLPAATTLRREALRMVQGDFMVYLGLQLGMGRPVDVPINQWQAAFLPDNLAQQLAEFDGPMLRSDEVLVNGPQAAQQLQPKYLQFALLGLLTVLVILLPAVLSSVFWSRIGLRLWLLCSGLGGVVLLLLWCCTQHESAWRNENLLLLLPSNLLLWCLNGSKLEKLAGWLIPLALLAAAILKLLPGAQFNSDLLLWLLPAQLTVFYFWFISLREQRLSRYR